MRSLSFSRPGVLTTAAILATSLCSTAFAQSRPDPIMSKDELRTCMLRKEAQEKEAASIKKGQADFAAEYDALKAEQAEINKTGEALRSRSSGIGAERDAISAKSTELQAQAAAAKSDVDRAAYEAERTKLLERSQVLDRAVQTFNADQASHAKRVEEFNGKIGSVNSRRNTVNDRVDPLQKETAEWRQSCGNRRYREEDETALKRELAAPK